MEQKFNSITDSIAKDASGWDEAGDWGDLQLYDATLQIDTKKFKKGDKVDCITFLYSQSICQLYRPVGETDINGFTATELVEEFPITLTAQL
jgi:hypothetical protein